MEPLQRLTRRQVDALRAIDEGETPERGAPLKGIARALEVRAPTALGLLTPLEELALITRHRGKSRLSPRGRATLLEYHRHHRIAEGMFGRLGLPKEALCRAATEIDLALSHATVERLCEAEGHPSECPHGRPIPSCRAAGRRG